MTNNIYFIANWKMYGNIESIKTIKNVISLSKKRSLKKVKIIYCPPYTLLSEFVKKTKKSKISVGAQNCHQHSSFGSFTGSINSLMVKNIGCEYIILGHSENRKIGDTDKLINTKIRSALKANLKIIFCIGETLKEKKNKQTKKVLKNQIIKGLKGIKNINNIIISYEPVWSIGTGLIPKIDDLRNKIIFIKNVINNYFHPKKTKILYGGSVNPKNVKSLKQIKQINGFLVGGASQNDKKFIDIIQKSIN
tara:strand:- start:380 stop:1129 length:750 start_codon:yes stop_codon:yes gene_type:complete